MVLIEGYKSIKKALKDKKGYFSRQIEIEGYNFVILYLSKNASKY